jgi:hypothetical protein
LSFQGEILITELFQSPGLSLLIPSLNCFISNRFYIVGHENGMISLLVPDFHTLSFNLTNIPVCTSKITHLAIDEKLSKIVVVTPNSLFMINKLENINP